jgi:hypothetical protein
MRTKAEEYRANALESFRQSQVTLDKEAKEALKALALRWYALADKWDEREQANRAA